MFCGVENNTVMDKKTCVWVYLQTCLSNIMYVANVPNWETPIDSVMSCLFVVI